MNPAEGTTVLGKTIQLHGEITGAEEMFIDGKFQGSIHLTASRLVLGPNAEVDAELQVQDLIVLGRHHGSVTATGRVELRQNAELIGDITAARLSIEESALLRGRVTLTGQESRG